jgi:hypothetical protein
MSVISNTTVLSNFAAVDQEVNWDGEGSRGHA